MNPQAHLQSSAPTVNGTSPTGRIPQQANSPASEKVRFSEIAGAYVWTVVGTLLPGVGLIRGGRVLLGLAIGAAFLVLPITLLAMFATGGVVSTASWFASTDQGFMWLSIILMASAVALLLVGSATFLHFHKSWWPSWASWTGVVILMVLAGTIAVPTSYALSTVQASRHVADTVFGHTPVRPTYPSTPAAPAVATTGRTNILLLGSDAASDRRGTRPDTIMVASVDNATKKMTLISLPRNLAKPRFVKGTPLAKRWPYGFADPIDPHLNAVWMWGETHPKLIDSDNPGLQATVWAVEGSLGITIDEWALVDMQGFADVVDALGGVKLTVNKRVAMAPHFVRSPRRWISTGTQTLDGEEALWFGRSRWGADDYVRMRRQRCLIGALAAQTTPMQITSALPELLKSVSGSVSTSIPLKSAGTFAQLAEGARNGDVEVLTFTNEKISTGSPNYKLIRQQTAEALGMKSASATPSPSKTSGSKSSESKASESSSSTTKKPVTEQLDDVCSIP